MKTPQTVGHVDMDGYFVIPGLTRNPGTHRWLCTSCGRIPAYAGMTVIRAFHHDGPLGPTRHKASLAWLFAALALMATLCPTASAEDDLGRLFFTPERRQTLDRQRQLNIQEKQEIPEDPTLTINGVVTRSSGKRTTWINGISQNENDKQSGVSVISSQKNPGKIVVQAADAPAGKANVGDTVNRNTGEATDLLGGGQISIKSSVAK